MAVIRQSHIIAQFLGGFVNHLILLEIRISHREIKRSSTTSMLTQKTFTGFRQRGGKVAPQPLPEAHALCRLDG
ncbi:hypothetical protein [Falsiroseomonas sp. E2-1-a4]|uniref:hypothetical protein n=1 Tax=Falsiroseomonas sp. E2-1-a4 TaxID=3239299 RepID=UPI003F30CADE